MSASRRCGRGGKSGPLILPRQGEVSPSGDGGGGHGTKVFPYRPLRLASAIHLPLAGEDRSIRRVVRHLRSRPALASVRGSPTPFVPSRDRVAASAAYRGLVSRYRLRAPTCTSIRRLDALLRSYSTATRDERERGEQAGKGKRSAPTSPSAAASPSPLPRRAAGPSPRNVPREAAASSPTTDREHPTPAQPCTRSPATPPRSPPPPYRG
jgi:hypothetical protein